MDNAPSHSAHATRAFLQELGINHSITPPQSPDLNHFELVWHDMKVYIAEQVKPESTVQLVEGILQFWNTFVTVEYCNSKIDHVQHKVIPKDIELNGKPTGL